MFTTNILIQKISVLKKYTFFLYFFMLIFSSVIAQKNIEVFIEQYKKQTCIVYIIENNRTLFSLSKKIFNIPIHALIEFNPEIEKKFHVGNRIYVPVHWIQNWGKIKVYHRVKMQETLYSLAKIYQIDLEKLKKINRLKENVLPLGFRLLIPIDEKDAEKIQTSIQKIDPTIAPEPVRNSDLHLLEHIVKKEETLYSIAKKYQIDLLQLKKINAINDYFQIHIDQILLIPLNKNEMTNQELSRLEEKVETIEEDNRTIWQKIPKEGAVFTLILPLNFSLNRKFITDPRNTNKKVYELTENALKFYAGLETALETANEKGIKYQMNVIDGSEIEKLENGNYDDILKKSDLFIVALEGSDLSTWFDEINKYKKPTFIAPYHNQFNPNFPIDLNPSSEKMNADYIFSPYHKDSVQLVFMAENIRKRPEKDRIIFIINALEKEKHAGLIDWAKNLDSTKIIVNYPNLDWENTLVNALSIDNNNVFIFPEKDLVFVSRFLTDFQRLRNQGFRDYQFSILGFETWISSSDHIEEELKFELNYQFVTSKYLNLETEETKNFLNKFYKKNNADAEEIGLFAFDLMMQIQEKIQEEQGYSGLQIPYTPIFLQFSPETPEKDLFILEYNKKNLKLQKTN